jgi:hypothetical protein
MTSGRCAAKRMGRRNGTVYCAADFSRHFHPSAMPEFGGSRAESSMSRADSSISRIYSSTSRADSTISRIYSSISRADSTISRDRLIDRSELLINQSRRLNDQSDLLILQSSRVIRNATVIDGTSLCDVDSATPEESKCPSRHASPSSIRGSSPGPCGVTPSVSDYFPFRGDNSLLIKE